MPLCSLLTFRAQMKQAVFLPWSPQQMQKNTRDLATEQSVVESHLCIIKYKKKKSSDYFFERDLLCLPVRT